MAGRKKRRNRFEKLTNSWLKADNAERQAFLAWLGQRGDLQPSMPPLLLARGRYLTQEAGLAIRAEMERRAISLLELNRQLGLAETNISVARALLEGMPLRLAVVAAIERWLAGEEGDQ